MRILTEGRFKILLTVQGWHLKGISENFFWPERPRAKLQADLHRDSYGSALLSFLILPNLQGLKEQNSFDNSSWNVLYGRKEVTLTHKGNSSKWFKHFYMSHFSIYRSSLNTTEIDYYTAVLKEKKSHGQLDSCSRSRDAMFNSQGRRQPTAANPQAGWASLPSASSSPPPQYSNRNKKVTLFLVFEMIRHKAIGKKNSLPY